MSPIFNADPVFSQRFQREANIVGQLSHPNIVSIYDIGCYKNLNYIAMDYMPGGSVHDKMRDGISTAEVLRVVKEVAKALDVAHDDVSADTERRGEHTARELVLTPDAGPARLVERQHRALVVGYVKIAVIHGQSGDTGHIARPELGAASEVEAGDASLKSDGADLVAIDHRQARDIRDPLELGRAARERNDVLPADHARCERQPDQASSGKAGKHPAAMEHNACMRAHGQ